MTVNRTRRIGVGYNSRHTAQDHHDFKKSPHRARGHTYISGLLLSRVEHTGETTGAPDSQMPIIMIFLERPSVCRGRRRIKIRVHVTLARNRCPGSEHRLAHPSRYVPLVSIYHDSKL